MMASARQENLTIVVYFNVSRLFALGYDCDTRLAMARIPSYFTSGGNERSFHITRQCSEINV